MAGPFKCIVADPPWPIKWSGGPAYKINGRGEKRINPNFKRKLSYPTMTVQEIASLAVSEIAADDAHLYLWTPDKWLISGEAAFVAKSWGFDPLRLIVWCKRGFGLGRFPRPQHEAVLVCRRGKLDFNLRNSGSVHEWKMPYGKAGKSSARIHSAKPEEVLDLVEQASPGPYLELFARRRRLGWSYWGNECPCDVEIPSLGQPVFLTPDSHPLPCAT